MTGLALVAAAFGMIGLAAPASAQWSGGYRWGPAPYRSHAPYGGYAYGGYPGESFEDDGPREALVPPQQIMRRLERQGFVRLSPPRLQGDVYVIEGHDAGGYRLRFLADAYTGDILDTRVLGPGEAAPEPRQPKRQANRSEPAARKPAPVPPSRPATAAPAAPTTPAVTSQAPAPVVESPKNPASSEAAKAPEPPKVEESKAPEPAAKPAPAEADRKAAAPAAASDDRKVETGAKAEDAEAEKPATAAKTAAPAKSAEPTKAAETASAPGSVRVIEGVTPFIADRNAGEAPDAAKPASSGPSAAE